MRSLKLTFSPWCIGGGKAAREIAKQFTLELTVSTPEASLVQPVAKQPLELSAKLTEGLLNKYSLEGVL